MTMRVGELKELLENFEDDQLVYIGYQPSWPLVAGVAGVVDFGDREQECPDHEGYLVDHDPDCEREFKRADEEAKETDNEKVVWIVASDGSPYERNPYAPRWLWDGDGWC